MYKHLSHNESETQMVQLHYVAAWTESGCLLGCNHAHKTVTSAVACINTAGGFVVAVETSFRELTPAEQEEFRNAMYGQDPDSRIKHQLRACFDWLTVNLPSPDSH
jgi:hypothetical protein